jgi:hypothetical protein
MSGLSILVCASLKLKKGWHTALQGTRSTHSIQFTLSGGRVLRFGGLNHYNPSNPLVFIRNSLNRQTLRAPPHLRIRAGAFCHLTRGFSHRHTHYKPGLALEQILSTRERGNQINQEVKRMNMVICFTEVRF